MRPCCQHRWRRPAIRSQRRKGHQPWGRAQGEGVGMGAPCLRCDVLPARPVAAVTRVGSEVSCVAVQTDQPARAGGRMEQGHSPGQSSPHGEDKWCLAALEGPCDFLSLLKYCSQGTRRWEGVRPCSTPRLVPVGTDPSCPGRPSHLLCCWDTFERGCAISHARAVGICLAGPGSMGMWGHLLSLPPLPTTMVSLPHVPGGVGGPSGPCGMGWAGLPCLTQSNCVRSK